MDLLKNQYGFKFQKVMIIKCGSYVLENFESDIRLEYTIFRRVQTLII